MDLAALIPGHRLAPMGIAATVTRAPSEDDPTIDVEWIAPADETIGEEASTEPRVKWVCPSTPAVDDPALLLIDSRGDAWALVFHPEGV